MCNSTCLSPYKIAVSFIVISGSGIDILVDPSTYS